MAARVERMKCRGAWDLGPKGKNKDLYKDFVDQVPGLEHSHQKMAYCVSQLWINFAEKCLEADLRCALVIEDYIGGGGVDRLGGGHTGHQAFDPTAFENVRIVASLETLLWYGLFEGGLDLLRNLPDDDDPALIELAKRKDGVAATAIMDQVIDGGMAWVFQPVRQLPSDMSVITDDRLRRWGLWEPGKKHSRDAWKHWVVRLRKMEKKGN
jgi:hypothetical protein